MQGVEHAGLRPLGEAPLAGRRRAAAELSGGSSRHGVEVRAMNTIAAKQLRSEMVRCRPPYGGARRRWQQRLHQRPQLVRHQVINKDSHGAGSCHTRTKERNAVLMLSIR
jgi:hypothetical protein